MSVSILNIRKIPIKKNEEPMISSYKIVKRWYLQDVESNYLVLAAVLISILSNTCVFADEVNLIQNAGFEEDTSGQPSFWSKYDWENKQGVSEFKPDDTQKHSGNRSGCIISNSPNDARYKQVVKVKGNTYYRLSCWIRTENVGLDNKGANLSVEGILDTSRDIKGTSDCNGKM